MCSGMLGDGEWTRRAEGLMQECLGCKRHAQRVLTSARLWHAQQRVKAIGVRTGDYRGRWTRTDDAPKMSF